VTIKATLDSHYKDREWPLELIDFTPAEEATWQGLSTRLANSDYDTLHILRSRRMEWRHLSHPRGPGWRHRSRPY
jgi:hypothetical protein